MPAGEEGKRGLVDGARAAMRSLFEASRAIDIRHFEESPSAAVAGELSPRVIGLVEQAITLAGRLLAHYDDAASPSEAEGELNFDLAVDTVLAQPGERKLADLSFMAAAELRARRARLHTHGPSLDAWEMVCDCGSALRRVQKSLGALELALCEAQRLPRLLSFDSELATSIQVRRQYAKLWRFVASQGVVGAERVRSALRGAGTLCAMLVGRDEYCHLRERDRYQLRQLQRRILGWLVQDPSDPRAGIRVWEDYAGFVEMLRHVNHRQELVQHDADALRIAEKALAEGGSVVLEGALAVLRRVDGLDAALDAAISSSPPRADVLLAETRRVRARFSRASVPSPASAVELF